jgi:hypothetical protein
MDLATEPIVRATSLAAHGSLAPVAGGSAKTAMAAPGTAAAISPAKNLRRPVAVPIVIDHSLRVCVGGPVPDISQIAGKRRLFVTDVEVEFPRSPSAANRHPAIPHAVIARPLPVV